jgi:hypothetical protein
VAQLATQISFDLFWEWETTPPEYRLWITQNGGMRELMNERTYTWKGIEYIREMIPIKVPPGVYNIEIEKIFGDGQYRMRNCAGSENTIFLNSTTFEVKA